MKKGSIAPSAMRSPSPMKMNMGDREGANLRSFSIGRNLAPCAKKTSSLKPGAISPNKIRNKYQQPIEGTDRPPLFQENVDYYKEFWRLFL